MKESEHIGADAGPSADQPTGEELMARFVRGEADAMEEILGQYGRPVFGYLYRQLGARDRAEDAYQEVFLKVVRAAHTYKPSARFGAWLFTIARNVVIDQARRNRFRETESLNAPIGDDGAERIMIVPHHGPDPEQDARGAELGKALEKAVAALSEEQREVFLLRERAGLSFKEIAKITKAPLNTVKTRMHYALNNLKKSLVTGGFMGEEA